MILYRQLSLNDFKSVFLLHLESVYLIFLALCSQHIKSFSLQLYRIVSNCIVSQTPHISSYRTTNSCACIECLCMCVNIHIHIQYLYIYIHIHTHHYNSTYIYIYIHTYTYIYIYIHIHTHTYILLYFIFVCIDILFIIYHIVQYCTYV